ncbi:hypothetical protein [Paracoccus sp. TOH]|uniref:hypothetical protein n=1 Tax=Paracoccus sp. TOH TaxID=1263728 RepID=UPI0025B242B7|nr:hypothetical protein [Paracoccus sp. TOH]WJS83883.1 hypothetical protein NBE95_08920 [Paracoccus sp. TOH]
MFGEDDGHMLTIFAARAVSGFMAKAALTGLFGAAQVLGQPLRVHTTKVRTFAKMMGAGRASVAIDGDGIPMGVFHGV